MARFAILSWNGAGNQPPMVGIAKALRDRGHDVTIAGYPNQREYYTNRGLRFVVLPRSSRLWQDRSPPEMFAVKLRAAWASPEHLLDVPQLVADEAPHAVIVDCLMFGALAALHGCGVPTVNLVHSAPGALLPPGGPFEAQLLDRVNDVLAEARQLPARNLWGLWARFITLCTSVRDLDPLGKQAPQDFEYVGPVFDPVASRTWRPPWSADDARPLVLVSFSTGPYWDQRSRIERTLRALADLPCRVVVTPGGADISALRVPSNAAIALDLPHALVLPHASATVTHAGHGTVIVSLLHGVPLVCLPNPAADQPALAAQVSDLGAGRRIDGESATPSEIADAVAAVLGDPAYAAAARVLAATIGQTRGTAAVVDRLERLVESGRR